MFLSTLGYIFQLRFSVVGLNRNDIFTLGICYFKSCLHTIGKLKTYISKHSRHTWKLINLIHVEDILSQLLPSIKDNIIRKKEKKERLN